MLEGTLDSKILIVSDFLRVEENAESEVLSGFRKNLLTSVLMQAGLTSDDYALTCLFPHFPPKENLKLLSPELKQQSLCKFKERLRNSKANVIVTLGPEAFFEVTGLKGLHKWHLSLVPAKAEYGGRKVLPLFHPAQVFKQFHLSFYLSVGAKKIREEREYPEMQIPKRNFLLNPNFSDTIEYLREVALKADTLSLDVETGKGQINTLGIAVSPQEAIAIGVLPDRLGDEKYYELWNTIRMVLECSSKKIAQNFLYDCQYLSKYGIYVRNMHHDTMWAMKFLHPELEKGLDNVGRIYTKFPYWKEDNKNWSNIRDWNQHYTYNCKDTTGTFAAYLGQKQDLKDRKLERLFYKFVMRFAEPIREMCSRGLPVSELIRDNLIGATHREIEHLNQRLNEITLESLGHTINPRSPMQLKGALTEMGFKLPKNKEGKDSSDKNALVKLKKKHKKEEIFDVLLDLSKKNKQSSSYLNFSYDSDSRVRYSLDGCGTETGRWAGYKDPWGKGFNPQTVPKSMRRMFVAEPGKKLLQIDLKQAESRYVAWEAPEPTLMQLINEERDIHKYVAARIYKKTEREVTKSERQLGKKSGHAANYGVGPRTFAESCLVEMGLSITESEAKRIIAGYYEVFPGIRRRQRDIEERVRNTKKLVTPLGRERYFYDRVNDKMFREAYAYCPQSTIPDVINHLMLYLEDHCELLMQCHDSLLIQVPEARVWGITQRAKTLNAWHPKIKLPGGNLVIPVDVEVGDSWGVMETI